MSNFAHFKEKQIMSKGVIATNCPSRTGEEWLEVLIQKSRRFKRPISWHEIKADPMINHDEILQELGPYANYERQLPGYKTTTKPRTKPYIELSR